MITIHTYEEYSCTQWIPFSHIYVYKRIAFIAKWNLWLPSSFGVCLYFKPWRDFSSEVQVCRLSYIPTCGKGTFLKFIIVAQLTVEFVGVGGQRECVQGSCNSRSAAFSDLLLFNLLLLPVLESLQGCIHDMIRTLGQCRVIVLVVLW